MNQTIRLSARSTPGTERTRCTAVSGKVWAKSTFGVFFDVTQRSASMCSMVIEALSSSPMNRPTWTNTRVTANATPDTVIRKRSLSCSRFLRARSTAMSLSSLFHDAAQGGFHEQLGDLQGRTPVHPVVVALGDLERDHAVHRAPDRLGHEVGVPELGPQAAGLDRLGHGGAEE